MRAAVVQAQPFAAILASAGPVGVVRREPALELVNEVEQPARRAAQCLGERFGRRVARVERRGRAGFVVVFVLGEPLRDALAVHREDGREHCLRAGRLAGARARHDRHP